jgi:hypothetical protein
MARGNDAEAAADELKAKLGTSGNAEDMIALAAEGQSPELRAANLRPVDQEATDELDEDKAQGFVGDRQVLGYAVRGPFLVVVSSDDEGFTVKQAFALDEKKAKRLLPKSSEEQDKEAEKEAKEREKEHAEAEKEAEKETAGAGRSGARK